MLQTATKAVSFSVFVLAQAKVFLIGAFADVLSGPHNRIGNGFGAGSGLWVFATLTGPHFRTKFTP